jgi:hypothetical protein
LFAAVHDRNLSIPISRNQARYANGGDFGKGLKLPALSVTFAIPSQHEDTNIT